MTASTREQARAAAPSASSWVSANAGSGKTRVLTARVARLLLAGTAPQKILCLTYTKAAAAEMQNRLFKTLGGWAMLEDAELRSELTALGETEQIPSEALDRARTLFARALETPGGLKIQTIHSFCDLILRRFPLEAGVSPRFEVLEDRQAAGLRQTALDDVAFHDPNAFAAMAAHASGDDIDGLLREIASAREAFAGQYDEKVLASALGVSADQTVERLHDNLVDAAALELVKDAIPILAASGGNDTKAAEKLASIASLRGAEARLVALEAALLTKTGEPRKNLPKKALREAHPDMTAQLDAFVIGLVDARAQRLALKALQRSGALNIFARAWLGRYEARKAALGRLDFDDLVLRARGLLENPDTAAWVLWRLDGGLDHILIDEAQDTSPSQWRVIEAVSSEFFVGESARALVRTIFVVGDEKQSIYSFQGADPAAFGQMRQQFGAMLDAMESELERSDLLHSFRSAPPILRLVDTVFEDAAGLGLDGAVEHLPFELDKPGRVEIWPFLPKPQNPQESPWDQPVDTPADDDPTQALAQNIAARVADWLRDGAKLPKVSGARPICARDVLILVQRRGALFHAVIRALKAAGVPVAGADVLKLGQELAVKDLLAALKVAATPEDDLSLAAYLRSPMGGFSERGLFDLAHDREGALLAVLRGVAPGSAALTVIEDLIGQADFLRPFELLQRALVRHDGRRQLVARLGPEAEDAIDALLDQALAYEAVEAPTLTGFLEWIERDDTEAKRRIEEGADQVRVMTVHGAKGLEAPIVILPDTAQRREGGSPALARDGAGPAFWKPTAADMPPALAVLEEDRKARARAENRRLLYVALTRAETWLIICGAGDAGKAGSESWYGQTRDALETLDPAAYHDAVAGDILRLDHNWSVPAASGSHKDPPSTAEAPSWLRAPPSRARPALPPTVSPSGLGGAHVLDSEDEDDDGAMDGGDARARGEVLHALLDAFAATPEPEWPRIAKAMAPQGADAEIVSEATAVLRAPELRHIFGPTSLGEVDICAPLAELGGARLSGRIDRLVVEPGRVLAVDFKSNRRAPTRPEDTPEGILRQLGAYRAALVQIWPDRDVEIAVLWTRTAQLMPIPHDLAAAALARAAALDQDPIAT